MGGDKVGIVVARLPKCATANLNGSSAVHYRALLLKLAGGKVMAIRAVARFAVDVLLQFSFQQRVLLSRAAAK